MDALEQYLIGGTTQSPITDDLLDRLKMVESSGNPKAVNKTSGALGAYQFMPDTVNMLSKQGVKFDPMDEKQSREAARTYLTQLYNQTGSIDKALAAYGGFKTADPTKYVQSIKGSGDPLEDYLSSGVIAPASAIAAPATPTVQNVMQKAFQEKQEIPQRIAGAADTLLNAIPQAIGGGTQFIERAFGIEGPKEAEQRGQEITEALSNPVGRLTGITGKQAYQKPLGGVTDPLVQQLNHYFNVMGITPEQLAEKTGKPVEDIRNIGNMLPFIAPEVAGALKTGAKAASGAISKALPEIEYITPTGQSKTGFGAQSIGAAQLSPESQVKSALSQASAETQAALRNVSPSDVNLDALNRHVEAESLPVPMRLTEGQASQDVNILSNEMNTRGKDPELAQRYNEQNGQLIDNINAIRDKVAPDVYATHHIENAENIINSYKDLDKTRNTDISNKFQALRDAAGGELPVDAKTLLENIDKKMKSELLSTDAQKVSQYQELKKLAENGSMSFDNFLNMRRNMSKISALDADASVRTAAKMMVQELDKLPLSNETAALTPLANVARSAARERFQLLEKDPAYEAAVNDVAPDKFVKKYVIGANKRDLDVMLQQLGTDSEAAQHVKAATINFLKEKAGIVNDNGNFSQSGYNKALMQLEPKLQYLVGEATPQLKILGNVARYTQAQPRGSFVNNSNTLVGALAQNVKSAIGGAVEHGLNLAVPYARLGTTVMQKRAESLARKATQESLKPGAGTRLSDIGKFKKEIK